MLEVKLARPNRRYWNSWSGDIDQELQAIESRRRNRYYKEDAKVLAESKLTPSVLEEFDMGEPTETEGQK